MTTLHRVSLIAASALLMGLLAAPIDLSADPAAGRVDTPTAVPTPPPATGSSTELRIDALEKRIDDLNTLVEVQSSAFDATAARMESNQSQLLAVVGVASLVVAVLGLGVARIWIKNLVEQRLIDVATEEFSRQVQKEIDELRGKWDGKFAELYREYEKAVQRANGHES